MRKSWWHAPFSLATGAGHYRRVLSGGCRTRPCGGQTGRFSLIIGAHFHLTQSDGSPALSLLALVQDIDGYGNLSELITMARTRAAKGRYLLTPDDFAAPSPEFAHLRGLPGCLMILLPSYPARPEALRAGGVDGGYLWQRARWIGLNLLQRAQDDAHRSAVQEAAQALGLSVVAVGHVCMHVRSRKPLLDTLCAIRVGKPVDECGYALAQNAEQHLRARLRLANVYPPQALAETLRIADLCTFSLDSLHYDYPIELVPHGHTPATYLREETYAGARIRFPLGIPANVQEQVEQELELIAELSYEAYFLTVYDIVRFARSQNILCQGRARPPIRPSAIACTSRKWTRRAATRWSGVSCRASATSRPISTSISSTSGAKR